MLREQSQLIVRFHKLLDLGLTAAAFVAAYSIKRHLPPPFGGLTTDTNYYLVLLLVIIFWYMNFDAFRFYVSFRRQSFGNVLGNTFRAISTSMLFLVLFLYILKIENVSRLMLGIFYVLNLVFLAASKGLVYRLLHNYRRQGYNFRNVLIVGSRERAKDVIRAIGDRIEAGFRIVGCLDVIPEAIGQSVSNGIRVMGCMNDLETILTGQAVDEMIFAMPLKQIPAADLHIAMAEKLGVSVRIIPDWQLHHLMYTPGVATIHFEEFLGLPTMALHTTPASQGDLLLKTAIDYGFAGLSLVVLLPFFLIVAAAIKLVSPGPVFFRQERCGLNGRRFNVLKFRTMVPDAEEQRHELLDRNEADGPVFKIKNDPRIIPYVGNFLRKTGLDELPQLINVLRGQMSLVGPRPPIPAEVETYQLWQRRRLSMKPGLTCIWQCAPNRNEVCFDKWMEMDLDYIDNWSLWLDFKIMLLTVKTVLTGKGR